MTKIILLIIVFFGVENYFWLVYWLLTGNSKALQILQLHHVFCKHLIQSNAVFIGAGAWFAYELCMYIGNRLVRK
jgi:hypothetical protein